MRRATPDAPPAGRPASAWRRFWREWVLGAILPVWLVSTFLVTLATVSGGSMQPALHSGDRLLLLKYPRWLHAWGLSPDWPPRGALIVFKGPPGSPYSFETGLLGLRQRPYLIKRVVGRPGDTVELRGGKLFLNGRATPEPYASGEAPQDLAPLRVPPGQVYVLGDNRLLGESIDSRFFGPVALRDVAGQAGARLWPVSR